MATETETKITESEGFVSAVTPVLTDLVKSAKVLVKRETEEQSRQAGRIDDTVKRYTETGALASGLIDLVNGLLTDAGSPKLTNEGVRGIVIDPAGPFADQGLVISDTMWKRALRVHRFVSEASKLTIVSKVGDETITETGDANTMRRYKQYRADREAGCDIMTWLSFAEKGPDQDVPVSKTLADLVAKQNDITVAYDVTAVSKDDLVKLGDYIAREVKIIRLCEANPKVTECAAYLTQRMQSRIQAESDAAAAALAASLPASE